MKTKQLFLSLLVLLTSSSAYAYDFELNGIYYNTTGQNTVEVTYVENGSGNADFYYGDVIIPQSIVRNGVTYSVTSIGKYSHEIKDGTNIDITPVSA